MNPERWQRIKQLFHDALELEPEMRAAFLDQACAGDAGARAEVLSLIAAHLKDGDFLDIPAAAAGIIAEGALPGHPASELEAGRRIGSYRIMGTLGAGGMGKVYLAQDTRLGRKVALKLLPASFMMDHERVQRFEQEARAASALNHPNLLTIHEIGVEQHTHYIATEFVEGLTLREKLKANRISLHEILEIAIQIGAALTAAHAARVVHRDIKPENIMVRPDGYIKVLDFGLAKPTGQALAASGDTADTEDSLSRALVNTQPGTVMGTMAYMSPEQARGLEVDARTDIWSLGVVLYEMLAGRAPFTGPTNSDVMVSVLNREPPPLAQYLPGIQPELERIVMKALAKDREERYQTAKDLLIDLRRLKQRMEFEAEMNRSSPADTIEEARQPGSSTPVAGSYAHAQASHSNTEQLKQVTILFADFHGLTALTEMLDAEEVSDIMRELWNRVDTIIMDQGGTVDSHLGNELMAVWGVPVAHEDDPEHALRAALTMQREVSEFVIKNLPDSALAEHERAAEHERLAGPISPVGPVMRVGINTGPVLLGAIGMGSEFTVTGAAVNVAQRLEQSAPAGSILISHDTYRHVRGLFDVQELELTNVKGRAEPARTYAVQGAKSRAFRLRTRGVEGIETRMVGRVAELDRLRDSLQTVIEDRELQVITIIGDAGLGKSRLLYEFSNEVELLPERVCVFNGRASQWTRGLPYSLVRDVFSFRFGIQESDNPSVARDKLERGVMEFFGGGEEARMRAHFIGHLTGLDFSDSPYLAGIIRDAKQVRGRAFHYASQFFQSIARTSPALIYLEDLHWADDGSLDFVDHLSRTCADVPLLVLCFARPDLLERRPAWGEGLSVHSRLNLQPLTRRESRQLVEEILRYAQSIPHALRELVVSAAEGNPFYVEELIKMLIDQKVILPAADHWRVDASRLVEVRVPPTLTGVLQARLDALNAWEKTVLQRASVIGREFWDGALERFAQSAGEHGENEEGLTAGALEELRRKELIYRRESSAFPGTREYIFKHALLRTVTYENVLKRDRRKLHREAAEWLIEQSGERVEEYVAIIAEHYEWARETARAAQWYGRAGGQARASYAPEAAINFYRKALDFMSEVTREGKRGPTSPALCKQAIKWYGGLGEVLTMQARYGEALEAYTLMREAAEECADFIAQARAWNGLTAVQEYQGDNRAALLSARRAEALAREAGDETNAKAELAVALNRQGLASHRLGDAGRVIELGQQILSLSMTMDEGARHARANGLKLLGVAHEVSGRFELADECFEQSLALLRELGDRRNIGFMLNNLGVIAHLQGDYELAVVRYEEALAIFREIGERTWELPTLGNLAGAQIGMENYAAAEGNLQQAVTMTGSAGHFALSMIYCYLAESFWGQGKMDEALETARTALTLGQKAENQDYIGNAWRTLGLVVAQFPSLVQINDRSYSAGACFAESLRVYTEMGAEAERARTLRDWARYEKARGEDDLGAAMWQESLEIFSRLKMKHELARMS
jgi:serine/threonine protein kinase/tetratricopeptide (TPR) repeat protein